ncbi:uncharacterized protein LOC143448366 [Clavelina lepadiformis]|uniref:uncharacterized protein LOC143448366 n=1 Tax=Clavelina lepadiformis TaxID=159417 RepID=UPI0040429A73
MGVLINLVNGISIASVFYSVFIVFMTYLTFMIWKRQYGKAAVNCWFCNTDCLVLYRLKNNWTCRHCQQYNGFTKCGDYNEKIPQMHDETMNTGNFRAKQPTALIEQQLKLCKRCSRNQHLKVRQLSQFEPIIEGNFNAEAKEFEKKLDKLYALCEKCQNATDHHIKMQDTILRGSMTAVKHKESIISKSESSLRSPNFKVINRITVSAIGRLIWAVIFTLACFYSWHKMNKIVSDIFTLSLWSFAKPAYEKDVEGMLVIPGCIFCVFARRLKQSNQKFKCEVLCTVLWFACLIAMFLPCKQVSISKTFKDVITEATRLDKADKNMTVLSTSNEDLAVSVRNAVIQIVLHCVLSFSLMLSSAVSFYYKAFCKSPPAVIKTAYGLMAKKMSCNNNKVIKTDPSNLDVSMYSDCSLPSDDDDGAPKAKRHHLNEETADPDLNGSLIALNLQDGNECDRSTSTSFKKPSSIFPGGQLPSTLHTPPPSRSSSLLSLSSQQSGFTSRRITTNCANQLTGMDMSRPHHNVPFQSYKTSTVIGRSTFNQSTSTVNGHRSVASLPAMSWQKSSRLLNTTASAVGNTRILNTAQAKRPLISPARLQWHNVGQRKTTSNWSEPSQDVLENSWEQKSDPDISAFDSISQVGEQNFPELSDDEEGKNLQTPRQRRLAESFDSSSPKSAISNLTSVTMRSVEEVENSRVCRWFLVACLLINLVLVILLVFEVKEIRELEKWKASRPSL